MKYLKRFNESNILEGIEEVKDFCEMSLAYLIDEGLEVNVQEYTSGFQGIEQPLLISILLNEPKHWSEISDHMIPFLTLLQRKYTIVTSKSYNKERTKMVDQQIRFYLYLGKTGGGYSNLSFTLDQVINNKTDTPGFTFDYFKISDMRIVIGLDPPKPKPPKESRFKQLLYKIGSL
jgi:hypothetical protein